MPGILDIISGVASGIISPVTTFFTRKAEIAQQNHANDLKVQEAIGDRQAELIKQGLTADAAWEMESIRAAGWGRHFELLVVSAPLVLCFTPWSYVVKRGFENLQGTPQWFQWLIMVIFLANYGIRLWRRQQSDT